MSTKSVVVGTNFVGNDDKLLMPTYKLTDANCGTANIDSLVPILPTVTSDLENDAQAQYVWP